MVTFSEADSAQAVVQRAAEAASASGADSLLWFNAASRLSELGEAELTAEFSMIAAVLGDPIDPESLALAMLRWLSLALGERPVPDGAIYTTQLLFQVAAHKYGRAILDHYAEYALSESLLTAVGEMLDLFIQAEHGVGTPRIR